MIRIRPQELVRDAEAAPHQEQIVRQPALQDLAFGRIGVISHHGHFGRTRERRLPQIGFAGLVRGPDIVIVLRGRVQRRVVAHQVIDGEILEKGGTGVPQIDVGVVAERVQQLVQGKGILARRHASAGLESRSHTAQPPGLHHALQFPLGRLWHMIVEHYRGQHARAYGPNAVVGSRVGHTFLKTGGQVLLLRFVHQVPAPVEDQSQLAEIAAWAERPVDRPPSHGLISRYLVVERRRKTRLGNPAIARSRTPRHHRFKLAPSLGRAFPFTAQQLEPRGPQEQPGMLGKDDHRFIGCDLRLESTRRQRQERELCRHQNRLCHIVSKGHTACPTGPHP